MRIPVLIIFLKIKVTNQVLKLGANEDQWEILPYHLAFARKVPSAIAINVDPFIATEEQDCANDMAISTSSPITLYKFMPMGKPHIFIILEDQRVFDFDATKENLVLASENNGENWPNSIINSMGVFFSNHFVTSGGTYSVSSRRDCCASTTTAQSRQYDTGAVQCPCQSILKFSHYYVFTDKLVCKIQRISGVS